MANGGKVASFCAHGLPHDASCSLYMAQGGLTLPQAQPTQPQGSQTPEIGLIGDPEQHVAASLAHMGAAGLFDSSAFGPTPAIANGDHVSGYLNRINKGSKLIEGHVSSLFTGNTAPEQPEPSDKELNKIKDYVSEGALNKELTEGGSPQSFAKGGLVAPEVSPLASALPVHNIMLNAAKARVNAHLNNHRPQEIVQKLPFDSTPSSDKKEKDYKKVVSLAARPLSILKEIKDGSLTPTQLKHFNSMYPELHNQIVKKMTEEITKAQLEDRKPSHRVRQAMSLFMGTALDSTMTPQNIIAAQNVFISKAQQQQAQQAPQKAKKGTAPLSKVSKNYETANQAAEVRQKQ